ncbi:hypothetical protein JNUCC74_04855 [Cerasibacillus sp. JNUCC 74]
MYIVFLDRFPYLLQMVLNVSLIFLATILSFLLFKELVVFASTLLAKETADHQLFLANILIFFFYFEFVAMIV